MARNSLSDLLDIVKQRAYYDAGGGRKDLSDSLSSILESAGTGFTKYADGRNKNIESMLLQEKNRRDEKAAQIAEEQAGREKEKFAQEYALPKPLPQGVEGPQEEPVSLYQKGKIQDIDYKASETEKNRRVTPEKRGIIRIINKKDGRVIREIQGSPGSTDSQVLVGEDGDGSGKPKRAIPADKAGLYTLAQESIQGVSKAFNTLFPKGTAESFSRGTAVKSNIPGSGIPILGRVIPDTMPFSKEGQDVNRWIGNALAGRQLIQTGVAARPDETASLVRRFMANVGSDPEAAKAALEELSNFYNVYTDVLTTGEVVPYPSTPTLDKLTGASKSGLTPEEEAEFAELDKKYGGR